MDKVSFVLDSKPNSKNPSFHVKYSGPIDYNIRFVLEHPDFEIVSFPNTLPGKEEADPTIVCKLQLADAGGPFSVNIYQKYEAESFLKALGSLSDEYSSFLHKTYPDFTFEMANILSGNGSMSLAMDPNKRAAKVGGGSKPADIVTQYLLIDSSKQLICIRIGFAWVPQGRRRETSFVQGRNQVLSHGASRKISIRFEAAAVIRRFHGHLRRMGIRVLVPRKRPSSRGEEQVQASLGLPPTVPGKGKKKARCMTPMTFDVTEPSSDSKFQERLLEEGCGSQVTIPRSRYIYPSYSPHHHYNPHSSCKYVGSPGPVIFPPTAPVVPFFTGLLQRRATMPRLVLYSPSGPNLQRFPPAWRCASHPTSPIGGTSRPGKPFATGTLSLLLPVRKGSRSRAQQGLPAHICITYL
jgi:hypothetical protein